MKKKNVSNDGSSGSVSQEDIDSCVTDLGRLTTTVSGGAKPLSSAERKQLLRPRKDGASLARQLAQLVTKYGVTSVVDVNGMLSAVTQAEQLSPLDKAAANFSVLVHDQALVANSSAWKSSTTAYTVLKRLGKDNPDLARDLQGVVASLKKPVATKASGSSAKSGKSDKATAQPTAETPEASPEPAAPHVAPQAPPAQ
jgi:deoxyribodipyrimidine photolyase